MAEARGGIDGPGPEATHGAAPGQCTACEEMMQGFDPQGVSGPWQERPEAPVRDRVPPPPRGRWVRWALWFYGGMAALAWLGRGALQGESLLFTDADAAARGVAWLADGALGVAAGLLAVVLSDLYTRRTRAGAELARELAHLLGPLRARDCLVLALASGVGEEALFRGALQPNLGLVGASLAFALAHLAPRAGLWTWSLFALAGGFLLGGLFAWTGNLLAPVLAHAVLNGVNLFRLSREPAAREPLAEGR